jgi:omega-3 fatty acid desaturase (delta-15 desaturase)
MIDWLLIPHCLLLY